jgi:photosystem II stability/assembly factor-like uncharacterized protein
MSEQLFVATRKGVFRIDRNGGRWTIGRASFLGDNCSLVFPDPRDGAVYAALGHGHFGVKMHRSDDGGATWSPIATPRYPEPPPGYQPPSPAFGKPAPWSLELVWSIEAAGPAPGSLWCGTIPGGIFRSDDGGQTWALNRALWDDPRRHEWFGGGADHPGVHSICVHPQDPDCLLAGVSCGGVWRSGDAGASWELLGHGLRAEYMPPERARDPVIQDPHRIAQCRVAPEVLYIQHHNGIFRSQDGGRTWSELRDVPPASFGFAVAVDPTDPDTAWFVPGVKDEVRIPVGGRVVVTRTRDGGRTFSELTGGLPQEHAYDLVFRHALDVDESGRRLAFGSTTGSLWISEDQGDRWTTISQHLPPIYAVRFVQPVA